MQIEQTKNQAKAYATPTIAAVRAIADFIGAGFEADDLACPPTIAVYSFGKRAHGISFIYDDGYQTFLKDPKYSI